MPSRLGSAPRQRRASIPLGAPRTAWGFVAATSTSVKTPSNEAVFGCPCTRGTRPPWHASRTQQDFVGKHLSPTAASLLHRRIADELPQHTPCHLLDCPSLTVLIHHSFRLKHDPRYHPPAPGPCRQPEPNPTPRAIPEKNKRERQPCGALRFLNSHI